jgi:hypothetical protein
MDNKKKAIERLEKFCNYFYFELFEVVGMAERGPFHVKINEKNAGH